ncbi:ATP synthase subunit I [Halomonas sp. wenzhen-202101]|uniref:ATP synthase subunit I n=1 Tax=Halomonas dongshanensis TaxID=2890835 RepID=A0ABT2E8F6_9GAMM|nr:ATP synthase subunit I [Halomonas dongshanensis]
MEVSRRRVLVQRLAVIQFCMMAVGALIGYLLGARAGAVSVLTGMLVAILPHAFFVARMGWLRSSQRRVRSAQKLFGAELGKFGLTVALFVVVLSLAPPSNPALFFIAYVAILSTHWLIPWLMPEHRAIN